MTIAPCHLNLSLAWADEDLHEVVIAARSELFSGATSLYLYPGDLTHVGSKLAGFPEKRDDVREFQLGQTNSSGYGSAVLRLHCVDSTGHCRAEVKIVGAPAASGDTPESCTVHLKVVPADIDRFASELAVLSAQGQEATLAGAA